MSDIHYEPEKYGLELVAEADYAADYSFDIFVVWREKATGRLLYAMDSG